MRGEAVARRLNQNDSRMQVRVPASSANLGPGFDSLGLALGIYLTCRFQRAGQLSIRASGRDAAQISTGQDGYRALEVVTATYESCRKGCVVRL